MTTLWVAANAVGKKRVLFSFFSRFVLRHNTNHRANGEATAHSNQAFGAFSSRVTPPELLYIWLLSFDELGLAMNAHLPVVRPLLCYARRGATPIHQKSFLNYVGSLVNTSHASLLSFLASGTRYDPHKWPHESTLFCPYL